MIKLLVLHILGVLLISFVKAEDNDEEPFLIHEHPQNVSCSSRYECQQYCRKNNKYPNVMQDVQHPGMLQAFIHLGREMFHYESCMRGKCICAVGTCHKNPCHQYGECSKRGCSYCPRHLDGLCREEAEREQCFRYPKHPYDETKYLANCPKAGALSECARINSTGPSYVPDNLCKIHRYGKARTWELNTNTDPKYKNAMMFDSNEVCSNGTCNVFSEICCIPTHCHVQWAEWTPCTKSCDGGTRQRSYSKVLQEASLIGGMHCPEDPTIEDCNVQKCHFDEL